MRLQTATLLFSLLTAGTAFAEPLAGKAAQKLMFTKKGVDISVIAAGGLSAADQKVVEQVAAQQAYYGAVAMSPDEGLVSKATLAAANYHDVDNARAAALAGCNAQRKPGTADCVIVAEIRPKGWEPRALQLNADASAALRKDYRKGRGAKALAISPATGKWAIVKEEGAADKAVASCAAAAGIDDCLVVVADQ